MPSLALTLAFAFAFAFALYFLLTFFHFTFDLDIELYDVNSKEVTFETDERFVSVALDTSFMRCLFHQLKPREWDELVELSSLLSPGYLRLGGTDADNLFFTLNDSISRDVSRSCSDDKPKGSFYITGSDWIKINDFARKTKLNFIFDLNVLTRSGHAWNTSNAQKLIKFSQENKFRMDFQLGNEPNSFGHVFNVTIPGSRLARDFSHLRRVLDDGEFYASSKVIGPDVTRPRKVGAPSLEYLRDFLANGVSVDAVSWHQYYFDGRTATLSDFLNPSFFEMLPLQIKSVADLVRKFSLKVPIWISETSSAWGGGAPRLSDRFVASFLWLDKLGAAAKFGISVVVRQSLFRGYYALISPKFVPSPNFWISFFYKNIVGKKVISIHPINSEKNLRKLRLYSHCLASKSPVNGSLVIFGLNLSNERKLVKPSGIDFDHPIYSYTFTPENFNLKSREVWLNDKPLSYDSITVKDIWKRAKTVELPLVAESFSIFFWIFQETKSSVCFKI